MSDIKPVYQVQQLGEWIEVEKHIFDELYIQNKFSHRILYPAAAYEALQKENAFVINDLHIARSHIGTLKAESAAQAKRISELESKCQESFVVNADKNLVIFGSKESIHAMNGLALEAMELRAKVAELDNKLHERTVTSGAKIHELNSEIESLRKQVGELLKSLETDSLDSCAAIFSIETQNLISALSASKNGDSK